jgi:4-hydroxybenzoate polyprenyltransferase
MKTLSLFSVVRIQYSRNYIGAIPFGDIYFSSWERALTILLDFNLFLLVFASSLTIASGYIINNFMTAKDLINRPIKLDRLVSQNKT